MMQLFSLSGHVAFNTDTTTKVRTNTWGRFLFHDQPSLQYRGWHLASGCFGLRSNQMPTRLRQRYSGNVRRADAQHNHHLVGKGVRKPCLTCYLSLLLFQLSLNPLALHKHNMSALYVNSWSRQSTRIAQAQGEVPANRMHIFVVSSSIRRMWTVLHCAL